ncbi:hypothetical protein Q1695_009086 [Nippostrongylus brasiliensis]|nr:hypothetical protein Q1695_009086 [Nippostrongylus brasiliensis]
MLILCLFALAGRSVQDECGALRGEGALSLHSFTSPSYPNRYPANMDCFRVIQARPGFDIFVHFHHQFQVETSYSAPGSGQPGEVSSNCPNDFVEFRDGRYGFSPLIGRFCGMDLPKTEIRARSGFLWIHFHSDELLEYKGFFATFDMVRTNERKTNQHDCQIQFQHALDGFIETKTLLNDMPLNFTGSLDCIWLIEVPHEYNIALYINEFSLYAPNNCGHNFVEIYSGTTSDQPLRRYCGLTASHVFSSHYMMYIRFYLHDANRIHNISVSALYSSFAKLKNCSSMQMFSCGDDNCVPQALVCNGRNNCPYGNDELNCHVAQDIFIRFVFNSYSPLIILIVIVFFAVLGLFLWYYWPKECCKKRRRSYSNYLADIGRHNGILNSTSIRNGNRIMSHRK